MRATREEAVTMETASTTGRWWRGVAAAAAPVVVLAMLAAFTSTGAASAAEHRLGIGGLYWRSLDDLSDTDFDEDGVAPYLTYQYVPEGIFRFEVDIEYYDKGFGGSDTTAYYMPAAYVLVEFGIYVGAGVGFTGSDGNVGNLALNPFYAARVGYDFAILPRLHLDINANYRAGSVDALEDYDGESLTFGAAARVSF